jgi:hypothetical protein
VVEFDGHGKETGHYVNWLRCAANHLPFIVTSRSFQLRGGCRAESPKGLPLAFKSPTAAEVEALITACHPDIHAMVAYWRGKRGARRMPSRSDIDPSELKPYLPRISLVDVVPDERRFVYRLAGTEEVALRGYDPTGKPVGEGFFGPNRELAFAHYGYVVDHKAPYCYRGDFDVQDGAIENEDVIFLPLSEDGDNVNMILVFYYDYRDQPRVEASSVLLRYQTRKTDDS